MSRRDVFFPPFLFIFTNRQTDKIFKEVVADVEFGIKINGVNQHHLIRR